MRRDGRSWPLALLLPVVALAGCSARQLGLPRVDTAAESPDGRHLAYVRNHPEIDPPHQSLWLERVGGEATKIEHLGADTDWCDQVVWSEDGSRVGFVVTDRRLKVVEAGSGTTLFDHWLLGPQGSGMPAWRVAGLELPGDGSAARYRVCSRSGDCSSVRTIPLAAAAAERQPRPRPAG